MRHGRATVLPFSLIGFLASLLSFGTARAETEIFGLKAEGEVEVGGQVYVDRPLGTERGKFEEYRGDVSPGVILPDLRLRLSTPDDRYLLEVRAKDVGKDNQNYKLRSSRLGRYNFEFEWDQTPHIFSTTGRLLGTEASRGVFTLPSPRPALTAHNSAPALDEIGLRWDTARFGLSYTPTPDWDLRTQYTRIFKSGDRPMGMAFGSPGNNHREILEPIEQTVHDALFSLGTARESYQFQFTYNFSAFQNNFSEVLSDNPCSGLVAACGASSGGAAAPATGRTALAPDNMAHTWALSGGVNLPLRTRVNSSLSYSWRLQTQDFLPHTINSAISNPGLALPASDLNGDVRVLLFTLNATSRPLPPLTLRAQYRLYDFDDRSDEILFPAHVVNDRTLVVENRVANRFPFTKHNASFDARWQFLTPLALTAGIGWERWDRSEKHREAPITDEYQPKAVLDYVPTEWLLLRATYAPSWRRIRAYNTFAHLEHSVEEDPALFAQSQHTLLRKYDEADRDRQRGDLLAQLTPLDTLTVGLTYSVKWDDYTDSVFGLQDDRSWAAGFDISWSPTEWLILFGSYIREEFKARQGSRYRESPAQLENPTYDWIARTHDVIDTVGVGSSVVLLPQKLDLSANYNFSSASSRMRAFNISIPAGGTAAQNTSATAVDYPTIKDTLHRIETFLRYHLTKELTAKLGYAMEVFDKTDFRTDGLLPSNPGSVDIFLGNDLQDYIAHIISLSVSYRF